MLEAEGKPDAAEPLYRRALAIQERAPGPDSRELFATLNQAGALHESLRDYEQAESLYARALAVAEKAYGPEHPATGAAMSRLGRVEYAGWENRAGRGIPAAWRAPDC